MLPQTTYWTPFVLRIFMPEKLTIDYVQMQFGQRGYILLSKEYENSWTKLKYECPKGHKDSITWNSFQRGAGCPDCVGLKRKTIEEVREYFEQRGFILLSKKYINAHAKLSYLCPEGHRNSICWEDFKQGYGCPDCAGNTKLNIKYIQQHFEQEGYKLLSTDYINSQAKIDYLCPEGHRGQIRWGDFQQGYRCGECFGRIEPSKRLENIREILGNEGYRVLTTQYVFGEKISCLCPKNHEYSVRWEILKRGHRCPLCGRWKNQRKLGEILREIFPSHILGTQDNLGFLGKMRVDYSIHDLKIVFEYDGIQHFEPTTFGGMSEENAEKAFVTQQERDRLKEKLCKEQGWKIVRIKYTEPLEREYVRKRVFS